MRNYTKKDTKRVLVAFDKECMELTFKPRVEKLTDPVIDLLNKTYMGLNNNKPLTEGQFTVEEDGALTFIPEKVIEGRKKIEQAGNIDRMLIIKEQVMHDLNDLLKLSDDALIFSPYDENGEKKSLLAA